MKNTKKIKKNKKISNFFKNTFKMEKQTGSKSKDMSVSHSP
jgi:hypothetical protein